MGQEGFPDGSGTPSAREIQRQSVVDRASEGELTELGAYTLRGRTREVTVTIPAIAVKNAPVGPGDEVSVSWDAKENRVVLELGEEDGG